jgi:hypothetical protein
MVVFDVVKMTILRCANVGAFRRIGSIVRSSESILVHLTPGGILPGTQFYNVYVELYNSINNLHPAHLDSDIATV